MTASEKQTVFGRAYLEVTFGMRRLHLEALLEDRLRDQRADMMKQEGLK